ncbi:Transcriptional regulator, MarR family [Arthrobacter sp. PAMC 25486]|nr:Transcriptional regulator, MarR family [Arthrobacter sp. PAMC 25486]
MREFASGLPRAIDRQLLQDSDVSGVEYSVLAVVSESPGKVVRSGDLAAKLGWDRSRVSHLLRRMEARGLIHRCAASADGRGQDIALTEAGWDKVRGAAPGHVTMVRETIFDPLTPEQQTQLFAALTSIRRAAEERGLW